MEGDDDEDDVDDIENEFNYAQGNAKTRRQWEEDADLSSSSRREYQQPIPLLTNGQTVIYSIVLGFSLWLVAICGFYFRGADQSDDLALDLAIIYL